MASAIIRLLAALCTPSIILAVPQNNPYDTQPIHTVLCSDKFYRERDKGEISLHLSPFYQATNTGRNAEGTKVPLGSMQGNWNMFALSFGAAGSKGPGTQYFAADTSTAFQDLNAIFDKDKNAGDNPFHFGNGAPGSFGLLNQNGTLAANLRQGKNFTEGKFPYAFLIVPTRYERIGIRSQLGFDFGFGLGVNVKTGVCDIKNKPKDIVSADKTNIDKSEALIDDAQAVYDAILSPEARSRILQSFGLDSKPYQKTDMEDTHIQVYWHMPIEMLDRQDELAMLLVPMISCGAWLPTGKRKDQQKIFSVATGNDGFYGLTVDAAFGLEFPVVPKDEGQNFGISLGGGAAVFASADIKDMRFATNNLQTVTILPWTADIVSKRPGFIWYLNASMKAEHFLETLSFYFDYLYTQHEKDDYKLKAYPAARQAAFEEGVALMRKESFWKNQQVQLGLKYDITPNVALGAAAQAHISGVRVARLVTIMGGMTVSF